MNSYQRMKKNIALLDSLARHEELIISDRSGETKRPQTLAVRFVAREGVVVVVDHECQRKRLNLRWWKIDRVGKEEMAKCR